ncbi:MAG TPA: 6-aminohexanoate hydrolase, partial [Alphaproteobacteria bacterium]|nr:6-aminohexanoate hydrolase [Alphaproteobacteria bacterium]
ERIVPREWIRQSWTPRIRSRYSGDDYGYGWFIRRLGGYSTYYGWGYGGQMVYVIPNWSWPSP